MKILSIDYGKKWIGLALADEETKMAFPYETLENDSKLFLSLNKIVKKEDVYKIVVGLPLNKQMKSTDQTVETENWSEKLIKKVEVPIVFENEIMTSKAAEKLSLGDNHSAAAAIILQTYLDRDR